MQKPPKKHGSLTPSKFKQSMHTLDFGPPTCIVNSACGACYLLQLGYIHSQTPILSQTPLLFFLLSCCHSQLSSGIFLWPKLDLDVGLNSQHWNLLSHIHHLPKSYGLNSGLLIVFSWALRWVWVYRLKMTVARK